VLPAGEIYALHAEAANYFPFVEDLDLREAGGFQEMRSNIMLDSMAAGGAITLKDVFFDFDRAELRPESHFELDRMLTLLKEKGSWRIRIMGFTDSSGDAAHNVELSRRRAQSVLEYFVAAGIDRSRLEAIGYGPADPVADNGTLEGRRANRRVVLRLISP
jgi:outer membrane protein OmpA-like peptidoglycan-associated protein